VTRSLSPEVIADRIALAIREKLYTPGTALVQEDLARRFEVSRSPVREALRILATEGLVTMSPGGGATVRHLGREDLEELYDLRILLEPTIAEAIVENATSRDIADLADLAERMEQSTSTTTWMRANFDFHCRLYETADRTHTQDILRSLLAAVQPYSEENVHRLGGRSQADHEHHEMIDAIRRDDADVLADLMREHLRSARSRLATAHTASTTPEDDPLAALRG
jgi:DNA-binding GntR family transcriptional regulator